MYVWMVIATFIVMLAAYNLGPRPDFKTQQQQPLAEASISKFLVQHNAAVNYAKNQFAKQMQGETIEFGSGENSLTGCNTDGEGSLCSYLPIGYQYNENEFYSKVYCLNADQYTDNGDGTRTRTQIGGIEAVDCSAEGLKVRYVITFGRVPERWKNVSTGKILGDFYLALKHKIPIGESAGIVIPIRGDVDPQTNPLESEYMIQGNNPLSISIPQYFLENDEEFKEKCTTDLDGQYPCLIYVRKL